MRIASSVLALFLILCGTARAAERSFYSGYIGTLPSSPLDRAKTYFNRAEVRALLAHLESGPLSKAEAERLLAGTGTRMPIWFACT